jgi:hypothetical protein
MPMRYAVYYVPAPESALWRFGCEVLGYDAYAGQAVPQWYPNGVSADAWREMTADPRVYGFHATLKAPFRLREGIDEEQLVESLKRLAKITTAADHGSWRIKPIASSDPEKSFLALTTKVDDVLMHDLEKSTLLHFEPLRAPLNEAEIARRNPAHLTSRQRELLAAYGYPYVLEEFRFHMTLSGAIENAAAIGEKLRERAEEIGVEPRLKIDRLALFRQDDGGPFRILDAVERVAPAAQ